MSKILSAVLIAIGFLLAVSSSTFAQEPPQRPRLLSSIERYVIENIREFRPDIAKRLISPNSKLRTRAKGADSEAYIEQRIRALENQIKGIEKCGNESQLENARLALALMYQWQLELSLTGKGSKEFRKKSKDEQRAIRLDIKRANAELARRKAARRQKAKNKTDDAKRKADKKKGKKNANGKIGLVVPNNDGSSLTVCYTYAPVISTSADYTDVETKMVPIRGAKIHLQSLLTQIADIRAVTDDNGIADIESVPPGTYVLYFSDSKAVNGEMYLRYFWMIVKLDKAQGKRINLIAEELAPESYKTALRTNYSGPGFVDGPQATAICGETANDPVLAIIPERVRIFSARLAQEIHAAEAEARRTIYDRIVVPGFLQTYLRLTRNIVSWQEKHAMVQKVIGKFARQNRGRGRQHFRDGRELLRLVAIDRAMEMYRKWSKNTQLALNAAGRLCQP
jgi:hypothetical protein